MKLNLIGTAILVLASLSGAARAAEIAERKTLTLDGAQRAIAAAVAQAHKNHAGGVIAVVDDGGNLMALERVDGTFAAGANISIGKARTERSTGRGTGHGGSCRGLWCSNSRYLLRQFACECRIRERRCSLQRG